MAWCFDDERTDAVLDVLHRVAQFGAVAPSLWPLEAVNGLLAAERRGRIDSAQRDGFLRALQALPVKLDIGTADRAWQDTAQLASQHRLTAYDAAYLELERFRRGWNRIWCYARRGAV